VALESTAGAWLGPVGVFVGPTLRLDGWRRDEVEVAPGLTAGPTGRLSIRVSSLVLSGGVTPLWALSTPPPAAPETPWHALVAHGAVALDRRPFAWRLTVERAQYGVDALWTMALGVQLRLL